MNEEMIEKAMKLSSKSYTDNYYTDKFRQEAFRLKNELEQEKEKNKKAIDYIERMEVNSIGTPFAYTAPGKELLKILKGE